MKIKRLVAVVLALLVWCGITTLLLLNSYQNGYFPTDYSPTKTTRKVAFDFAFVSEKTTKTYGDLKVTSDDAFTSAMTTKSIGNVEVTLNDVFITVKTTKKYHSTRLKLLLKTWWTFARNQTYLFTDVDDEHLFNAAGGHVINTKCGISHDPANLCCKMGCEYDAFVLSEKKWWCHVDDDNYVNVGNLLKVLREYDWRSEIYLGRRSVNFTKPARYLRKPSGYYWFLTGGAGVCISKGFTGRMDQWCRNGSFTKTCRDLGQPDDTTLGFIINNRLGVNITERVEFNSHIQKLELIPSALLPSLATLSYGVPGGGKKSNVVVLDEKQALFTPKEDSTRFLSYHCMVYPNTDWCVAKKNA